MKFSEKKKLVIRLLEEELKPLGYKAFKTGMNPSYLLFDGAIALSISITYSSAKDHLHIGALHLTNYQIEDIILSYDLPKRDFTELRKKEKHHISTVDSGKVFFYNEALRKKDDTEEKVRAFVARYMKYFHTVAVPFVDKYSYLPNILKEMNRLDVEGVYWNRGILSGAGDSFFRGVIIAKLCNDPLLPNKIKIVDELFYDDSQGLEAWQPHWQKLQEQFKIIEPKYNL